jgi:hypothetical protein
VSEATLPNAPTIDDLRRKAQHVRDLAETEARALARDRGAQMVAVGVVVVLAAVSLAYYLGRRHRA